MKKCLLIYPLVMGMFLLFTTSCSKDSNNNNNNGGSSITDADGNIYHTVIIGTQTWMAENLKTTKYNDGSSIPNVTARSEWIDLSTGAYCNYNNQEKNATIYGRLYNWYAVNTGKLAPKGWHVPTDAEWTVLADFLGGEDVAGDKMKTTTGWEDSMGATNESGFSALPGGFRLSFNGAFHSIGSNGVWWTSTRYNAHNAWDRELNCYSILHRHYAPYDGFSVRCVKD